jgi:hypothetical protein
MRVPALPGHRENTVGEIEMTELTTTFSRKQRRTGEGTPPDTSTVQSTETTLITEQQVLMSTAAAVAIPPAKTRRFGDVVHALAGKVRAVLASSEKPPARKHYPKRHVWLDNALMAREMDRL